MKTPTYKLIQKVTDDSKGSWSRIANEGKLKCRLIIDENGNEGHQITIRRYETKSHMFYVHSTDGALTKVCVYERIKK